MPHLAIGSSCLRHPEAQPNHPTERHSGCMRLQQVKRAAKNAVDDVMKNHTMAFAASLSYFFVLSLFPLLIVLAALVAYLPIPNLFDSILGVLGRVVPPDSMGLVRKVLHDVIQPHQGLLTLGIV